jgi:hypothetical protein
MTIDSILLAIGFWSGAIACLPPTVRVVRRWCAVDYSWWGFTSSLIAMSCTLPALAGLHQWLSCAAQLVGYLAMWTMVAVKYRTEVRGWRVRVR